MLSEYISLEIDLEILDLLRKVCLTTEYWSVNIGEEWNGSVMGVTTGVHIPKEHMVPDSWY